MHLKPDEINRLSPPERLAIIEQLWVSLDSKDVAITQAQKDEFARRMASFEDDRGQGVTWEALKAELDSRRK